jgi:predicted transcriptional regulator
MASCPPPTNPIGFNVPVFLLNEPKLEYILEYMKTLIVELDDEVAAKLERVAPGRARQRSEFIRNAVRKALWEIEEQATAEAYRKQPDTAGDAYLDVAMWESPTKSRRLRKRR